MPLGDVQFWIASVVVLGAAAWIGRGVFRLFRPGRRRTRASLTVERERVEK